MLPADGHFSLFWLSGDIDDHNKRYAAYDFLFTFHTNQSLSLSLSFQDNDNAGFVASWAL